MLQNQKEPAKLITLLELFDGRKFEIPDYQRGYSWDEEQVLDLLTDIEMHNSSSGHKHFTGTIVVERPNGGNTYQIVDGQQRLVTCVMILRAIVEMNPRKLKGLESILTKTRSGFETAIILGDYDDVFFTHQILNGKEQPIETSSNKRLSHCYSQVTEWLKEKDRDIEKIFHGLTTQLGFIFFETSSARETTTMFEVINNRGKELSELEKFKNYFLYLCHTYDFKDIENDIHSEWGEILIHLEKAGFDTISKENQFVRTTIGVIFEKVKKETDDLYKDFREYIRDEIRKPSESGVQNEKTLQGLDKVKNELFLYLGFLKTSSWSYAYLFNRDGFFRKDGEEHFSERLDQIFAKLRNHGSNGSVLSLFLVLCDLYYQYPDCRDSIIEAMDVLEKLNFRLYCLPRIFYRSDTKRAHLISLASEIYCAVKFDDDGNCLLEWDVNLQESPEYYIGVRKHFIKMIEKYCPESKFVEALTLDKNEVYDFYSWSSLKFLISTYESHLRRKTGGEWNYETLLIEDNENSKMTKEHILAVDQDDPFPDKDSVEKRRIGNFMLVDGSLNSSLGNKSIEEKIATLRQNLKKKNMLFHVREVIALYEKSEKELSEIRRNTINRRREVMWKFFDERETNIIKFALKEWAYPGEPKFKFEKVDTLEAERKKLNTRCFFRD